MIRILPDKCIDTVPLNCPDLQIGENKDIIQSVCTRINSNYGMKMNRTLQKKCGSLLK